MLQHPGGETVRHEVTGPPGVVRFAVGTHTRRSSIWRVWSDKKRSDVYVGLRTFAGYQKYSLHESGSWHHAFVDDDAAQAHGFGSRFIDSWDKPANAGAGWTKALAVKVLPGSLSDVPDEPDDDDVLWLPEPAHGRIAVIWIAVVEVDRGTAESRGVPVAAYRLANGNAVVVMYETEEMTDDLRRMLEDAARKIPIEKADDVRAWLETAESDALRIGFFGSDADDVRVTWDLRIEKAAPDDAASRTQA